MAPSSSPLAAPPTSPGVADPARGEAPAGALFTALYAELHGLASKHLSRLPAGRPLSTTTLLHEAYLNMSDRGGLAFPDRGQFIAYSARVMRGLLIDYVRERKALKRGGQFEITTLEGDDAAPADEALVRLGAALDELAEIEPELAQVVDLKFFCGFSFVEIAALKGLSERTVQRHWEKARIYLHGAFRDAHAV
jgi:RNA polymerase sigma factor (TIGR02999 family)